MLVAHIHSSLQGIAYDDYTSASDDFDRTSVFDENVAFEEEGINIIDFTEKNPFGNFK